MEKSTHSEEREVIGLTKDAAKLQEMGLIKNAVLRHFFFFSDISFFSFFSPKPPGI